MLKNIFSWIIDKWLAGFITGTIFFLLKLYADLPVEQKAIFFNFTWLKAILNTDFPLWKTIVTIVFIIIMFWTRNWWKKRKDNSLSMFLSRPNDPAFNYRIDIFGINNAKWTWDYDWDPYKKAMIVKDVFPLCPVCITRMEIDGYYSSHGATCVKCRLEGKQNHFSLQQIDSDVTKEIIRRLNSGEWKSRMK